RALVGELVATDLGDLARQQAGLLLDLPRLAAEAQVHEADADVDDVTSVAAPALAHQRDQRLEDALRGVLATSLHAALELLVDDGEVEGHERDRDERRDGGELLHHGADDALVRRWI